jgi:hypothetical protein
MMRTLKHTSALDPVPLSGLNSESMSANLHLGLLLSLALTRAHARCVLVQA